jgi:hypothetical protein
VRVHGEYRFNDRGSLPLFAADRRMKRGDGSAIETFDYDVETWQARLSFQKSGLKHPGDATRSVFSSPSDISPGGNGLLYANPFGRFSS